LAINKRKVLDAARKFAQKGAKQKALKEYNKLIQVDPRDAKLLLEVGDAYRRWGQVEEAITQYNKVANQYKQDGFDARAVAVLKQILNLDPKYHVAHVSLAELYQRMGLESDAIASLQTAADTCYKEGRRKEALELLRKMAALDPSNTTSRLKVADLLKQEGLEQEAVTEYEAVAGELGRQGASEQVAVVQERILEIQPDRSDLLVGLARTLCDLGRPERAEPFALRAVENAPEPDTYELLCGVYKALNNDARLAEVTRDLAGAYRARGDEDRAREVMQRLPSEAVMPGADLGGDRSEVDESLLSDDELLEDDDFLVADDEFTLEDEVVTSEPADSAPEAASVTDAAGEMLLPEGDPDQLFAEASVYLRYGKRDQAIANLKAILLQEPEHRGALEKLGEAYAEAGDEDQSVACWRRAAETARGEGDAAAFGILRDRIAALDPVAAEGLEPMVEADVGDPVGQDESEFELEFDVEDPAEAQGDSVDVSEDPEEQLDIDLDGDAGFSLDLDAEEESPVEPEVDESEVEVESDPEDDATDDEGFELDIDLSEELSADPGMGVSEELDIPVELEDGPTASATEGAGQSTMTAAQVQEDLEEADFYIQQGLSDEAEAIYRRILAVAPNHPSALLKLGELAAARGEDPGEVTDSGLDTPESALADEDIEPDVSDEADADVDVQVDVEVEADDLNLAAEDAGDEQIDIDIDVDHESEIDLGADETDGIDLGGADEAADEGEDFDVAEEFGLDLSEDEEAEQSTNDDEASLSVGTESARAKATAEAHEEVGEDSTQVEPVASPVDPPPPFETEPLVAANDTDSESVTHSDATQPYTPPTEEPAGAPLAAAADDDASFDLGEALADVFDDGGTTAEEDPNETSAVLSTVEDGFESIFADFKKGVSATLGEGDYETRFDLGIAYREMGLYDDAVGEFRMCLDSDDHRFQSLSMMGLCAFEVGRLQDAINHFEQALASEGLAQEQQAGVNFDLGRAHVSSGDSERARAAFERVKELDASFPGVDDQLDALASGGAEAALELQDESDEWESFDDIMGDDDADDVVDAEPEPEGETFESFDDVITEAEAIVDAEPIEEDNGDVELDVPAEPEPPAPEDTPSPRRVRKKKISFV
jgi:tetratricopeptide (TPR) repeat protein